jgi:hypothetical protein
MALVFLDIIFDSKCFSSPKQRLLSASNLFQTSTLIFLSVVTVDRKYVKLSILSNIQPFMLISEGRTALV